MNAQFSPTTGWEPCVRAPARAASAGIPPLRRRALRPSLALKGDRPRRSADLSPPLGDAVAEQAVDAEGRQQERERRRALHACCHVRARGREAGCRGSAAGGVACRRGTGDPRHLSGSPLRRYGSTGRTSPDSPRTGGRTSRWWRVAARPWRGRRWPPWRRTCGPATCGSCRTCSLTSPSRDPASMRSSPAFCRRRSVNGQRRATVDARRRPREPRTDGGSGHPRPASKRCPHRRQDGRQAAGPREAMAWLRIDQSGPPTARPAPSLSLIGQAFKLDVGRARGATEPIEFASKYIEERREAECAQCDRRRLRCGVLVAVLAGVLLAITGFIASKHRSTLNPAEL